MSQLQTIDLAALDNVLGGFDAKVTTPAGGGEIHIPPGEQDPDKQLRCY